ncbi:MAG: ASKHA domain-containing protein [Thermodesulfobacteriota bacterium]
MESFAGRIDLEALGLDHQPLAWAGELELDQPSLRDNTGLADRLARAAAGRWGLSRVVVPLSLASRIAEMPPFPGRRLWVSLQVENDQGRLIALDWSSTAPESRRGPFGLAVDVGSTTLVLALVDLGRAVVEEELTLTNPQVRHGADILSRAHIAEKAEGLAEMTAGLLQAINNGLAAMCRRLDLSVGRVSAAALAGNTVMTHFLLGLPVRTVIREPYVPVLNRPAELTASAVGLEMAPEAPVLVMPNRGAYFGGDLVAGLVVAGLARAEEPCLMVDVGTNAEVVLGQKDWLVGAAGAAGPALESGVTARGMTAGPGAIDRVRVDRRTGEISWRTMAGARPRGLCGSGLIDLLAESFLSGLIDFKGRLTLPPGHPRRTDTDEGPALIVVPADQTENGRPILLTEVEIDILIRSKAAMYTILNTVTQSVGLSFDQIDRFFVAGTFGQHIDPRQAVAIGLVPDLPLEKFVPLGNSSLKGTILALLSNRARVEALDLWRRLTYLEMNVNQDLMNRFSAARFLPHTDRRLFPSVGTTII